MYPKLYYYLVKQFKVDTELPSVENQSDRWITEDGDSFYYDMNEISSIQNNKI